MDSKRGGFYTLPAKTVNLGISRFRVYQIQRRRVQAIAQSGRLRTVGEDVAQVGVALGAGDPKRKARSQKRADGLQPNERDPSRVKVNL